MPSLYLDIVYNKFRELTKDGGNATAVLIVDVRLYRWL